MQNPLDFFRDRLDRVRSHPFQALAGGALGMAFPGAGILAGRGFDAYNNHQFNNSAQTNQDISRQLTDMDTNNAMTRPLNGPLGNFDNLDQGGGSDNTPLAQALSGGGNGGGYGGPVQQPFPGNYGNNYGQGMQSSTPWTQQGNPGGLLDFLGPNPNQPGMQGDHRSHQEIMDDLQAQQNNLGLGTPALYGVSNMMVGGAPVINGMRPAGYDPNGMVFHHNQPGG